MSGREQVWANGWFREPRGATIPRWISLVLGVLGALTLTTGCAFSPIGAQVATPAYRPSNVFREEAFLPPEIKRVAVLPLTSLTDEAIMDFGRESLAPILLHELGRVRLFELVPVSREELRLLTGREEWSGEERLPPDFFDRLKETLGVDAVLFSRLTQYRAYEPLAVGWRLKLLDAEEPQILWTVDEVFDARRPEVAKAARQYAQDHSAGASAHADAGGILQSPRRFGQYTASAVAELLPGRKATAP